MKAEKFLEQLGLSVNIVIVILLLVIVYYLYCINDNLSLERFSIGGPETTGTALTLPGRVNNKTRRHDIERRTAQRREIKDRNMGMAVQGGKRFNGIRSEASKVPGSNGFLADNIADNMAKRESNQVNLSTVGGLR